MLYKAQLSKAAKSCIEAELSAQIEKALADGIEVTHLDSERHVHFFPPINKIVVSLAQRYGIMRIRHIRKGCGMQGGWRRALKYPGGVIKERLLTHLSGFNCANVERAKLVSPDYLVGIAETGHVTDSILDGLFRDLPEGVTEIMFHPGYMDEETARLESVLGTSSIDVLREGELEALLQPHLKALADELGIRLIHYGDIPSRASRDPFNPAGN